MVSSVDPRLCGKLVSREMAWCKLLLWTQGFKYGLHRMVKNNKGNCPLAVLFIDINAHANKDAASHWPTPMTLIALMPVPSLVAIFRSIQLIAWMLFWNASWTHFPRISKEPPQNILRFTPLRFSWKQQRNQRDTRRPVIVYKCLIKFISCGIFMTCYVTTLPLSAHKNGWACTIGMWPQLNGLSQNTTQRQET